MTMTAITPRFLSLKFDGTHLGGCIFSGHRFANPNPVKAYLSSDSSTHAVYVSGILDAVVGFEMTVRLLLWGRVAFKIHVYMSHRTVKREQI